MSVVIRNIADLLGRSPEMGGAMVRVIGDFDVRQLDRAGVSYIRVDFLPQFRTAEESSLYSAAYEKMTVSGSADIRVTSASAELARRLAVTCDSAVTAFRTAHRSSTPSSVKNFTVKLLFRIDAIFGGTPFSQGVKIVCFNVSKLQEYLCLYALSLLGANVLMVQNGCDIDEESMRLGLSEAVPAGEFGKLDTPVNAAAQKPQDSANIKVKIPPKKGRAEAATAVTHPSAENKSNVNTQTSANVAQIFSTETRQIQRPSTNAAFVPIERPQQNVPFTPIKRPAQNVPFAPIQRPQNIAYTHIAGNYAQQRAELSYEELACLAPSVVQIFVIASPADIMPNGEFKARGSGSGVMIGEDGYIVTNCHVAAGGKIFAVRIENDDRIYFTDRLVKYHDRYDLAILKIDRKLTPLPVYSGMKPLARGQRVVAIGSPLGLFNTVSDGMISGFRRINGSDMIQFTAPISEGSSGGAVLNMYGELIGISTAGIENDSNTAQNINLAVSCSTIRDFCGNFITKR